MSKHHDNTIPPPLKTEDLIKLTHDCAESLLGALPPHFRVILTIVENHPSSGPQASTSTTLSPKNTEAVLCAYLNRLGEAVRSGLRG